MNFLRRKWNSTIRVRLTLLYAASFFLAGLALIVVMYFQLNQVIAERLIFRTISVENPAHDLADDGATPPTALRLLPPLEDGRGRSLDVEEAASGLVDVLRSPATVPGLEQVQAQIRAQMRTARADTVRGIMVVSVVSLVVVSAIAAVLGWLLAGQTLRPLRQITATARGIADRNLHQRIGLDGPQDEIKNLADTLDDMLERLDRAFESQQRFIANASHELRTPLTINRTLIEVAMMKETRPDTQLQQLGSTRLAVNQRHERLMDGLLLLAGSEQQIVNPQPIDLAEIAEQILLESEEMARSAGVNVQSHLDSAPCKGDPVLLESLIQNLTDNAMRYNLSQSGWIRVTTGVDGRGCARISVENSGPVIPLHEVPRLFEPFRRLSSTERLADSSTVWGRRGAGLGLSIVRSIVTTHGGELDALPREEGGLLITVVLPPVKP